MNNRLTPLLVAVLAILCTAGSLAADTVRLVQYEASPMAAAHLPDGGVWCRTARAAFALQGHTLTITWAPVKRAMDMVAQGEADFSLGWLKTPEREERFRFSAAPIAESPVALFHRSDTAFDWNTLDDLQGLRIGDRLGNVNGGDAYLAAERAGTLTVERVGTDEQNIRKLLTGRIDVVIGAATMIRGVLEDRFSEGERVQIVAHPKPLHVVRGYAIFNRQLAPALIQAFDNGMDRLRRSERLDPLPGSRLPSASDAPDGATGETNAPLVNPHR